MLDAVCADRLAMGACHAAGGAASGCDRASRDMGRDPVARHPGSGPRPRRRAGRPRADGRLRATSCDALEPGVGIVAPTTRSPGGRRGTLGDGVRRAVTVRAPVGCAARTFQLPATEWRGTASREPRASDLRRCRGLRGRRRAATCVRCSRIGGRCRSSKPTPTCPADVDDRHLLERCGSASGSRRRTQAAAATWVGRRPTDAVASCTCCQGTGQHDGQRAVPPAAVECLPVGQALTSLAATV